MVVLQKFVQSLQDMYSNFEARGLDPNTSWTYRWVNGWYKDVMRTVSRYLIEISVKRQLARQDAHLLIYLLLL